MHTQILIIICCGIDNIINQFCHVQQSLTTSAELLDSIIWAEQNRIEQNDVLRLGIKVLGAIIFEFVKTKFTFILAYYILITSKAASVASGSQPAHFINIQIQCWERRRNCRTADELRCAWCWRTGPAQMEMRCIAKQTEISGQAEWKKKYKMPEESCQWLWLIREIFRTLARM